MKFLFNSRVVKNNLLIIALFIISIFIFTKVSSEHPFLTFTTFLFLIIIYYYFYKLFKALDVSKKYLKTVFDTQENIIIVTNGKYITDANRAFFKFFGYESLNEFRKNYDCVCELFENLDGDKVIDKKINDMLWIDYILSTPNIIHKVSIKQNNKESFFKVNVKNLDFDRDRQKLVVFSDISELLSYQNHLEEKVSSEIDRRMKQEQLLIQQSKMASMGEMIGAIAHQWRQPLNALALIIQDAEESYEYGDLTKESLNSMVDSSMKQIEFMSNTLNEFRNFFRPNKKRVTFDIKKVIDETLFIISAQLEKANIKILIVGESFEIDGYPNEFKQVILNIITNSKDAIISKKIKDGKIEIDFFKEKKSIKISDNGGGVKEQIVDRIFEPYFTTKGVNGTGIGLYISKVIIEENLKGKIDFKNMNGGVEFLIEFGVN